MFVPPTWVEGLLIQIGMYVVLPLIIAIISVIVIWKKSNHKESLHNEPQHKESNHNEPQHKESHHKRSKHWGSKIITFIFVFIVAIIVIYPIGCVYWFNAYEVPSIQEKTITVQGWEPRPGIIPNNNGMMTISNADQLLLVTTENEGFFNMENFLFGKFNTRDIFNQLKVGGTYKIRYYGWRNGFNSGFPNILSVEQVVNETGAKNNTYGDYFGTKLW
ncbi:DUF1523 family protein [Methanobacterium petrolearium]|uniref:DUF1523 family protein n=1 Tax=Methanobacterium petrolearium TaxID=710190 RepID=UPI001AE6805F|nr:DUF1523 family protein [Methanobacterium petrolearium]MBP1945088.1 hypothetical protein [Methanobacterium petrolearium]BDZ71008.1 hypothetical protein GCM10025861_15250 [Methanobacterium petrolearium]